MDNQIFGFIATIIILVVGLGFCLNLISGGKSGGGSSFMGYIGHGCIFAIFGLVQRLFTLCLLAIWRLFIITTELITGVPDPMSYETSLLKLAGFTSAFLGFLGLGYNALALLSLTMINLDPNIALGQQGPILLGIAVSLGFTVFLWSLARYCMRRM